MFPSDKKHGAKRSIIPEKIILQQSNVSSGPALVDILDKLIRMDVVAKEAPINDEMMCRTDGSFPQFHQRFHPRHSLLYFIYCYLTHLPSTAFLLYNVSCKAPHNSRSIQGKSARLPERFFRLRISYCTAPVFRTSRPLGLPR